MKYDHKILFELIPECDKASFLAWENVFRSTNSIVAIYRAPFTETIKISLDDYNSLVKQKNRENKLDNLLD